MSDNIAWEEATFEYVACCYGADGGEPGDCYTRVGQADDGRWWVDDGDDVERDIHGPYSSEEEARSVAEALAEEQDEGVDGEDAEEYRQRTLRDAAGSPDPDGEYAVYWGSSSSADEHVVARYDSAEAAEAAAELANDELHARHPGQLLCGYEVRRLEDGDWVAVDDD